MRINKKCLVNRIIDYFINSYSLYRLGYDLLLLITINGSRRNEKMNTTPPLCLKGAGFSCATLISSWYLFLDQWLANFNLFKRPLCFFSIIIFCILLRRSRVFVCSSKVMIPRCKIDCREWKVDYTRSQHILDGATALPRYSHEESINNQY